MNGIDLGEGSSCGAPSLNIVREFAHPSPPPPLLDIDDGNFLLCCRGVPSLSTEFNPPQARSIVNEMNRTYACCDLNVDDTTFVLERSDLEVSKSGMPICEPLYLGYAETGDEITAFTRTQNYCNTAFGQEIVEGSIEEAWSRRRAWRACPELGEPCIQEPLPFPAFINHPFLDSQAEVGTEQQKCVRAPCPHESSQTNSCQESMTFHNGFCRPCCFHSANSKCKFGSDCDFCHHPIHQLRRKQKKNARRKTRPIGA